MKRCPCLLAIGVLLLTGCGPTAAPLPESDHDQPFPAAIVLRNMTHDVHRFVVRTPADSMRLDCDLLLKDPARFAITNHLTRHEIVLMSGQQMRIDTDDDRDCNLAWIARQPYAEARPDPVLIAWENPLPSSLHTRDVPLDVDLGNTPTLTLEANYSAVEDPPEFGTRPCLGDDEGCLWHAAFQGPPEQTHHIWSFHQLWAQVVGWTDTPESRFPTCTHALSSAAIPPDSMPMSRAEHQLIPWTIDETRLDDEGCQEILLSAPTALFPPTWYSWHTCLPDEFLALLEPEDLSLTFEWFASGSGRHHRIDLHQDDQVTGSFYVISGFSMEDSLGLELTSIPHSDCDSFPLDCQEVGFPVDLFLDDVLLEVGQPQQVGEVLALLTRAEYRAVVFHWSTCSGARDEPGTYFELVLYHPD
jgi:hypothetical protein